MKITFRHQLLLSVLINWGTLLLHSFTAIPYVVNMGYIAIGLLFLINPVYPNFWSWQSPRRMEWMMRLVGLLAILVWGIGGHY